MVVRGVNSPPPCTPFSQTKNWYFILFYFPFSNLSYKYQTLFPSKMQNSYCLKKEKKTKFIVLIFFNLLLIMYVRKKLMFWGQIFEWRFWCICKFWGPLIPKVTFLAVVLSISACVLGCVFVSVSAISINQKDIIAESSNLAFFICIISRCYMNFFTMIGQKFFLQGYTKEF